MESSWEMMEDEFLYQENKEELVLNDQYFSNLYHDVMRDINLGGKYLGKKVIIKEVYFLEQPICKGEFPEKRRVKFFASDSLVEEDYYKELIESKGKIHKIRMLFMENEDREIITRIRVPVLSFQYKDFVLFESFFAEFEQDTREFFFPSVKNNLISSNFMILKGNPIFSDIDGKKANKAEIWKYLEYYCQKDNYIQLVNTLIRGLESCKFSKFCSMSSYLPKKLYSYYEYYYKENLETITTLETSQLEIEVKRHDYSTNLKLYLEIKEKLNKLEPHSRQLYLQKLDALIKENPTNLLEQLINLSTEITCLEMNYKETKFNYSLISNYFHYFDSVSCQIFSEEDIGNRVKELISYINCFENHKGDMEFSNYCELQNLIFRILTNVMIYNPNTRGQLLTGLSELYQDGIYSYMNDIMTQILDEQMKEEESDETKFSIYSMMISEMDDLDFIQKGLSILDRMDKEQLNLLDWENKKGLVRKLEQS